MSVEFKKILVAFDESEPAKRAFEYAKSLADKYGSHITLLQVLIPVTDYLIPDAFVLRDFVDGQIEIEEKLRKELESKILQSDYARKNAIDVIVMRDTPKNCIVDFAKNNGIDLIVMGATGKHGVQKVFIGSTTSYVMSRATCNVLMIK
ncbi:universal stress protein [Vagococcus elongatus]|nr:universal stress protein [Vagococcus elongatus]